MIERRVLFAGSLLVGPALSGVRATAADPGAELRDEAAHLERRHGGRLGVAVLDTAQHRPITYRGDERFPLCSTHKFIAAALVLARVDRGEESLTRRIAYAKDDLVPYSPITAGHVGRGGMTVGELCEAAMTVSDNTAANLLLDSFGGPAKLTAYVRSLGDGVTRLDRREPTLNEAKPGDPRDTTSPRAILGVLRETAVGTALSAASSTQLAAWLVANKTGDEQLRAGVPKGWRVGDKTGSGGNNATNDVAVIWPPRRAPIIVAAFYVGAAASITERSTVLSALGRRAAAV